MPSLQRIGALAPASRTFMLIWPLDNCDPDGDTLRRKQKTALFAEVVIKKK